MASDDVCGACGTAGSPEHVLQTCSGCGQVKYCNATCKDLDREAHASLCVAWQQPRSFEERRARIRHLNDCVFYPGDAHGFMYTCGIAENHGLEFISLEVPNDDDGVSLTSGVQHIAGVFNFLAERLQDGHEVKANPADRYAVLAVEDDVKRALIDRYAVNIASHDIDLLLILPVALLPFTLPIDLILHKWRDATSILELAIWKASLEDREEGATREECRASCGANVIIPGVLPFLSGIEVGEKTEAAVGGQDLMIMQIREKLGRMGWSETPDEILLHQLIHNAFNRHPTGKSSMTRGMLIRHLNGWPSDNRPENLAECTVYDALDHIDEWTTDWECFLDEDEQQFVRDNIEAVKEVYYPVHQKVMGLPEEAAGL